MNKAICEICGKSMGNSLHTKNGKILHLKCDSIPVSREDVNNGDVFKQEASVIANGLLSKPSSDNQDKYIRIIDIVNNKDNRFNDLNRKVILLEDHEKEIAVNRSEIYDEMNKLVKEKEKEIQRLKEDMGKIAKEFTELIKEMKEEDEF